MMTRSEVSKTAPRAARILLNSRAKVVSSSVTLHPIRTLHNMILSQGLGSYRVLRRLSECGPASAKYIQKRERCTARSSGR